MKSKLILCLLIFTIVSLNTSYLKAENTETESKSMVITDGVEPGKFTQDYDAAMAYAKEKSLPVMLIFTGSDWCGWCKLMDKNVFSKPEWTDYAKDHLVQVWLDFPRKNKDLVPEKYRNRNKELAKEYQVRGYPTYIFLDSDGSRIGKLGAGRDKTPSSFIAEVKKILLWTKAGINAYIVKLKPENAKEVARAFASYQAAEKIRVNISKALKKANEDAKAQKENLEKSLETAKINAMSDEQKVEYETAKKTLQEANDKLNTWIKKNSRKRPTPELREQFNEIKSAVSEAQKKVDSFQ